MSVDIRGFRDDHIGKRLRVELQNGEVDDINLLELTICEEPRTLLRYYVHLEFGLPIHR
jgi:hypothetical protein